jgi:hypothetical protein
MRLTVQGKIGRGVTTNPLDERIIDTKVLVAIPKYWLKVAVRNGHRYIPTGLPSLSLFAADL